MRKLVQVVKKEEILQTTWIIFVFGFLGVFIVVFISHLILTKEQFARYLKDPSVQYGLFVSLIWAIAIALVAGVCLTLWKLKWPSQTKADT